MDESWAGEIYELSSYSWDVCHFVGVRKTLRSGSWSAIVDSDCYVKDEVIFLFYSKLTLVQFKNVIVSTIMNAKLKD